VSLVESVRLGLGLIPFKSDILPIAVRYRDGLAVCEQRITELKRNVSKPRCIRLPHFVIQFANRFDSKSQSIMFTENAIVVSNRIRILFEKNVKRDVY
jgi:hypothetical protein